MLAMPAAGVTLRRTRGRVQYLNRMQRRKEWGGHLELQAISNMLKVNICVHQVRCGSTWRP